MTPIRRAKTTEKGFRPFGHRSVELHFGFCFQQNAYGGWGRGLKDTGRGLQESPESRVIADIARDRDSKTSPRMNSDDTDQESLRWSGMRSRNLFVFLIEAWGWGCIAGIARHRAGSEKQNRGGIVASTFTHRLPQSSKKGPDRAFLG
jgi:hypothetical protein